MATEHVSTITLKTLEFVTPTELAARLADLDIPAQPDLSGLATKAEVGVAIDDLEDTIDTRESESRSRDTALDQRVSAIEDEPLPVAYNDAELRGRIVALEGEPDPQAYDDAELRSRIEVLEAAPAPGGGTSREGWRKFLSSFGGSNDDAKMATAVAYVKGLPQFKPEIVLDEMKVYTFSANQGSIFTGLAIAGPDRFQDQGRSGYPFGNLAKIRTNGPWFSGAASGQVFCLSWRGISFDGVPGASLIGGGAGVTWRSVFHNLHAQNFGNLWGSSSSKWLNTACTFSGDWNINNVTQATVGGVKQPARALVPGGSDTSFNFSKLLLDSEPTMTSPNQYLAEFDAQSKGSIEHGYITAEACSALKFGSSNAGRVVVSNTEIEGRNAGQPSPGCLVRVEGSDVVFRDVWAAYAMANPAATGRNDAGIFHIASGMAKLLGIDTQRATGQSETVPLAYFGSTAKGAVSDVYGKGYTAKPRVMVQRATGESDATLKARVRCDSSVTLVDAAGVAIA